MKTSKYTAWLVKKKGQAEATSALKIQEVTVKGAPGAGPRFLSFAFFLGVVIECFLSILISSRSFASSGVLSFSPTVKEEAGSSSGSITLRVLMIFLRRFGCIDFLRRVFTRFTRSPSFSTAKRARLKAISMILTGTARTYLPAPSSPMIKSFFSFQRTESFWRVER